MNNIKKIIIIEDEEANAQRLQRMVMEARPNYIILDILSSIKNSVKWLLENDPPDLIFLDIQLSDGVSFEIFNLIEVKCPVIFTTAYDEFAVKAFKYNSVDYLLKPVEKEELAQAILKFEELNHHDSDQNLLMKNLMDFIDKREYRARFLVPYRDGFKQISVATISYFFSESGSTFAVLSNGEENPISQTLESLEEQLDPKQFFRANRKYMIHINSIHQVHNYFDSKLKLFLKQGNKEVIVSRLKASSFKEWLDY